MGVRCGIIPSGMAIACQITTVWIWAQRGSPKHPSDSNRVGHLVFTMHTIARMRTSSISGKMKLIRTLPKLTGLRCLALSLRSHGILNFKTMSNVFRFIMLLTSFLWCSCEDVINVKLSNADPQLVIVGVVSNQLNQQQVTISRTVAFGADQPFAPVSGADVEVVDGGG